MGLLACSFCRSRKIACDRKQPACTRCLFSGKTCEYRARKSAKPAGTSRLKSFEARLGNLESRLVQGESSPRAGVGKSEAKEESYTVDEEEREESTFINLRETFTSEWVDCSSPSGSKNTKAQNSFSEIVLQRKLYDHYFQQVNPSTPIIHKSRFFRALEGDPIHAPPLALRYAIWATAALVSAEHQHISEKLYILGRKHAEDIEMQGGLERLSPSHAQCWFLLASYEASRAYFARAWLSVGRCVRLVQMMSLHRLDSPHNETHVLQQRCWTELEEGRRTFWAAYLGDRWASTLSGHPHIIKDQDICVKLPSSEQSFDSETEETGISVPKVDGANIVYLSPFAGSIFTTTILGRSLDHIRTYEHDALFEINSYYWESHREIDTAISLTFLSLPSHLRVSPAEEDVHVVFSQFNLHLAVILLHQVAIKIGIKQVLDQTVRQKSFQRCLTSALVIKDAMYSVRDFRIFSVSVLPTFCIYIAAGVFIEDMSTSNFSPSSPVDLGLLMISLKEIGALQGNASFFSRKLESDISNAGVACYIPTELRVMAGISISERRVSSRGASHCDSNERIYN